MPLAVLILSGLLGAFFLLYARLASASYGGSVDSPDPVPLILIPDIGESLPMHSPAQSASETAYSMLRNIEGFSETPYPDPPGQNKTYSIAYGYQLRAGEWHDRVSREWGENKLRVVVHEVEETIRDTVSVPLSQPQYDALVLFIYNIGQTAWRTSTMRRVLNDGDYAGAAAQFPRWIYANKAVNQTLVRRRQTEQSLFITT